MKKLTLNEVVKLIEASDIAHVEDAVDGGYVNYIGWKDDTNRVYVLGIEDWDDIHLTRKTVFEALDEDRISALKPKIELRLYKRMLIK